MFFAFISVYLCSSVVASVFSSLRNRLQRRDRDDVRHIFGRAAARKIVRRTGQPLQHRAERLRAAQTLHQLVSDVAGVEVRKDKHIRASRHRRAGGFRVAHVAAQARRRLAVLRRRQVPGARAFRMRRASRTFSTRAWLAEPLVENESIATRGSTSSSARAFSAVARAISASSSGLGSGTTAQSAKEQRPGGSQIQSRALRNDHDEEAGNEPGVRRKTDHMQRRAHRFRRRICGAAHGPVGVSGGHRQSREIQRAPRGLSRFLERYAARAPAFVVNLRVGLEPRSSRQGR